MGNPKPHKQIKNLSSRRIDGSVSLELVLVTIGLLSLVLQFLDYQKISLLQWKKLARIQRLENIEP